MGPGASRAGSRFVVSETGAPSVWGAHLLSGLKAVLHPQPQPDRKRKTWPPMSLAILDMANAASLLGAGDWIDQTSRLTMIMSWGGHHNLLLIISLTSFVLLATLASLTEAFAAPSDLQFALIVFACMTSIVWAVRCHSHRSARRRGTDLSFAARRRSADLGSPARDSVGTTPGSTTALRQPSLTSACFCPLCRQLSVYANRD